MTVEEMKKEIDKLDYQSLLSRWRFAPMGSPWFQGEVGKYYSKVMAEKRKRAGDAAHTAASKAIGW
jgi:hypothetical protein